MPTWNPGLAIGVPQIDNQHVELFARADALLAAMSAGSSAPELVRLIAFVADYVQRHFSDEERLMRERRYPALGDHLAQHREFTRQFEAITADLHAKGPSSAITIRLQQLVCRWLVAHIGSVDKRLAAFLSTGPVELAG